MLQFNEEFNQQLEVASPLIVFFGLSAQEQLAILPVLEVQKYDFPDGDLITHHALEVLINTYSACSQAIAMRLIVMQDETDRPDLDEALHLIESLLELIFPILQQPFDRMGDRLDEINRVECADWVSLRQCSAAVREHFRIEQPVDAARIALCIRDRLHP